MRVRAGANRGRPAAARWRASSELHDPPTDGRALIPHGTISSAASRFVTTSSHGSPVTHQTSDPRYASNRKRPAWSGSTR